LAVAAKATEMINAGQDVINLAVGEPDFDTPENIKNAAKIAIDQGFTKYTAVDGTKELKEAVTLKLKRDNHLDYALNQVMITNGGKQALYNAMVATLNPADEVLIPSPYWVSYPDMVLLAGGKPIIIQTHAIHDFKLTPDLLRQSISVKSKWLILNSPSNPTGSVYSRDELRGLAEVLIDYPDLYIITDDIYEHLIYDDMAFCNIINVEPSLKSRCLIVNGVSKSYSMTGWRIGFAAGERELISAMTKIQSQATSNPCTISQKAAIEALNGDQGFLRSNLEVFARRKALVYELINQIEGLSCAAIQGAFYAFVSCEKLIGKKTLASNIISNDTDFASYLLQEALVAVVPGEAFGQKGFFRISFALSDETLTKALERIKRACATLLKD
jgi:aspartate aminotransferase